MRRTAFILSPPERDKRMPILSDHTPMEPLVSHPAAGDILAYLQRTSVLGTSDEVALHEVIPDLEWVTVPAGTTLLRQGEEADALYIVVDGCLQAVLTRADGSALVVNTV